MRPLLALPALFLLACTYQPGFDSDEAQVHFYDPDLWSGMGLLGGSFGNEGPLVAGTRFCPELTPTIRERAASNGGTEQVELPLSYLSCFDATVLGPMHLDGDCLVLESAGQLHWTFDVVGCPWTDDDDFAPVADQVTIEIAGPAELQAVLEAPADELAEELYEPGETGWPEDARPEPGGHIGVVAGAWVGFPVVLETLAGAPATFAWGDVLTGDEPAPEADLGYLRVAPLDGELAEVVLDDEPGQVAIIPAADSVTELSLELDGYSWTAATLETVTEADVTSMELVVAWSGSPAAARAVIRTSDGMLVYGAPVEWEVDGPLQVVDAVETFGDTWFPGGDYTIIELVEAWLPASQEPFEVSATLTARWGSWEQTIELEWTQDATLEPEPEDWESEFGDDFDGRPFGGCRCDRPEPPPLLPFMVLLPAVPLLRRRRW